jgi:hypothetical protein
VTDYQKININFIKTIATERVSNFSEKKKKKKKKKRNQHHLVSAPRLTAHITFIVLMAPTTP